MKSLIRVLYITGHYVLGRAHTRQVAITSAALAVSTASTKQRQNAVTVLSPDEEADTPTSLVRSNYIYAQKNLSAPNVEYKCKAFKTAGELAGASYPGCTPKSPLIAKRRAPKLMQKYKKMTQGRGLLEWTEVQGTQMTEILNKISPETGPHKYFIGFRYSKPLIEDALVEIEREGVEQVVAFSQYPQYSCCTTGSNLNAMYRFYKSQRQSSTAKWKFIDRWPVHNAITQAYADIIKEELNKFPEDMRQQVVILFSAHSLPMKVVERGDTYPAEVAATVVSIMAKLKNSHPYRLVWQSKVGPMPWLRPKTEEAMRALVKEGHRHVMVVPVSFVNEHVETLYDMDIELGQELAPKIGILNFARAPALNNHPVFAQGLADLVKQHLKQQQKCSPQLLMTCPMCTNDTCKKMREWVKNLP